MLLHMGLTASLVCLTSDATHTKEARIVTNISPFIIKYRKVAQGEYMYEGGFDNVS